MPDIPRAPARASARPRGARARRLRATRTACPASASRSGPTPPRSPRRVARPLALPAPIVNADWSHRNGAANGRYLHVAFAADPQLDLERRHRRRQRTAHPADQRADRRGRARLHPRRRGPAFGLHDAGELAWRRSLAPEGQNADSGPGGGMAEAGGVLYVTTGFGEVMALDPATGGEFWRETLDAPIRAAPDRRGRPGLCRRPQRHRLRLLGDRRRDPVAGPGHRRRRRARRRLAGGRGPARRDPVHLGRGARRARAQRPADLGHRGDRRTARTGAQPHQRHHRRPGDRRRDRLRLEPVGPDDLARSRHRRARTGPSRKARSDRPGPSAIRCSCCRTRARWCGSTRAPAS